MYSITVISVGKLKEKFLKLGVKEYAKRLKPYAKVKLVEVADESIGENSSEADMVQAMEKEADRIVNHIPSGSLVVTCDLGGELLSSEQFAKKLSQSALYGKSKFCFIIGGSVGLHDKVRSQSDLLLSFGKLTLPHQLMRVVLLEQIYRAMRIINNEPYHK